MTVWLVHEIYEGVMSCVVVSHEPPITFLSIQLSDGVFFLDTSDFKGRVFSAER